MATILSRKGKKIKGLATVLSAINRKQLFLCRKHHLELETGNYSALDSKYLSSLYYSKVSDSKTLNSILRFGNYNKKN
jgi:hypothetical protein